MSSGLPYLNKLRKPELADIAEKTSLKEYVYHRARARPVSHPSAHTNSMSLQPWQLQQE